MKEVDSGGFIYSMEELRKCFEFCTQNLSDEILQKCLELCTLYNINEEDLVDQCIAFNISHNRNRPITIQSLELMERKELTKLKHTSAITKTTRSKNDILATKNSLPISQPEMQKQLEVIARVPENLLIQETLTQEVSSQGSQVASSYLDRKDAGKVLLSYGSNYTYPTCSHSVEIKMYEDKEVKVDNTWRYMIHSMRTQSKNLCQITDFVAGNIAKKYGLKTSFNIFERTDDILYGRIKCDTEGKLNNVSVMLETTNIFGNGESYKMKLNHLTKFSLFPGQIVIFESTILRDTVTPLKLYTNAYEKPKTTIELNEPLQIIAACGPFTLRNNLDYQPLQDLLKNVLEARPHVLLLTGPFLEAEHDKVVDGSMTESYDSFFYTLIESIMSPLVDTNIQVVIVSSYKDVHHHNIIYPTPPYNMKHKYPNLLFVPDPSTINIQGVVIGITTADILFHIGKQELAWSSIKKTSDRMARLSMHLLQQRSFYPLYPPDKDIFIDDVLLEAHAVMDTTPHILIVPSNFKYFIKKCAECTVVNPERLVKGYTGGSFAKFNIDFKNTLNVSCEIFRI